MKATKSYGPCDCGCGERINRGKEFEVVDGIFYLKGHSPEGKAGTESKKTGSAQKKQKPQPTARKKKPGQKPVNNDKDSKKAKTGGRKLVKRDKPKPKPEPEPEPKPKPKKAVKKESPNRMTIEMVIGQKHSDEEIAEEVAKKYPDREMKKIRMDVSVNRSMLNSGKYYKTYIEQFKPDLPLKKLIRVNGTLYPADSLPEVQEKPAPAKRKGLLKRTSVPANKG